jgi:hypothetical protein
MNITVDSLLKAYRNVGREPFGYDPQKPYNLNIIGVRSDDMTPDIFNDCLAVLWEDEFGWNLIAHKGTTDPGAFYLKNPMNVNGTFILAPGFHKGLWTWALHKGKPAFKQAGVAKGWRDADRDNEFDMTDANMVEVPASACINGHAGGRNSTVVGRWSAGCQVRAREVDHELLEAIVSVSLEYWGNSFSNMLFTESQLG